MRNRQRARVRIGLTAALFVLVSAMLVGLQPIESHAANEPSLGDAPVYTGSQPVLSASASDIRAAAIGAVDTSDRAAVASFFQTNYLNAPKPDAGWAGDVLACKPGSTSAAFKAAVLQRINVFRALAGVPIATRMGSSVSAKDQKMAVMISKASELSHHPDPSWPCYTADGAEAAASSNIFTGVYGWEAVDGYIWDWGNGNQAAGHRRWLLYPQTQVFGTGDIPRSWQVYPYGANAIWVFDSHISDPRPAVRDDFIAWPPQGYTPYQLIYPRWSFSYGDADFSGATVRMRTGSKDLQVTVESKADVGYGENTIVWTPATDLGFPGKKPSKDTTYKITIANVIVDGVAKTFTYDVIAFDPLSAPPPSPTPVPKPSCSLNKTTGPVQSIVTLTCANFKSGEAISAHWDSAANKVRATTTAASDGSATMTFVVPDSTAGRHSAVANGATSGLMKTAFTVVPKISISPTGGEIGTNVSVTLRGYRANETVTLWVGVNVNTRIRVATGIVTGASGRASATFTMPDVPPGDRPVIGTGSLGSEAQRVFQFITGTAEIDESTPTVTATPTVLPVTPTETTTPSAVSTETPAPETEPIVTQEPTSAIEPPAADPTVTPPAEVTP